MNRENNAYIEVGDSKMDNNIDRSIYLGSLFTWEVDFSKGIEEAVTDASGIR